MTEARFDYLEEFTKLIPVRILGREFEVPENNTILRVLQYLEHEKKVLRADYRDFCWNQECAQCRFYYRRPGDPQVHEGLGCSVKAFPYMDIVKLPETVRIVSAQAGQSTTEYALVLVATLGAVLALVKTGMVAVAAAYLDAAFRFLAPYP